MNAVMIPAKLLHSMGLEPRRSALGRVAPVLLGIGLGAALAAGVAVGLRSERLQGMRKQLWPRSRAKAQFPVAAQVPGPHAEEAEGEEAQAHA